MNSDHELRTWFRGSGDATGPDRLALLCFPWAGAGTAAYHGWSDRLPNGIRLWCARLPGREDRIAEPPATDRQALVTALAGAAVPLAGRPYAMFGHSLGARLAVSVTQDLLARRLPPPTRVFVSGALPAAAPGPGPALSTLDDEDLVSALARLHPDQAPLFAVADTRAMFLPAVRADLGLAESYEADPAGIGVLPCPVTAFGAVDDPLAPPALMARWAEHTRAGFDLRLFQGGHLFPLTDPDGVTAAIGRNLTAPSSTSTGEGD